MMRSSYSMPIQGVCMNEELNDIERMFLALGDKTRIRLIHLMSANEVSVNYLSEALGVSQPKVSRHLAYLRTMGMVQTRRDGKWIYYSLIIPSSPAGASCFRTALNWIISVSGAGAEPKLSRFLSDQAENINNADVFVNPDTARRSEELEVHLL